MSVIGFLVGASVAHLEVEKFTLGHHRLFCPWSLELTKCSSPSLPVGTQLKTELFLPVTSPLSLFEM